jgi:hypothetical protein
MGQRWIKETDVNVTMRTVSCEENCDVDGAWVQKMNIQLSMNRGSQCF